LKAAARRKKDQPKKYTAKRKK